MQADAREAYAALDTAQEQVRSLEEARDALQRQMGLAEDQISRLQRELTDSKVRFRDMRTILRPAERRVQDGHALTPFFWVVLVDS